MIKLMGLGSCIMRTGMCMRANGRMTRQMGEALIHMRMGRGTRETGKMINNMDMGLKHGLIMLFMRECIMRGRRMGEVN